MELVALKSDLAFRAVFGRDNERCKIALKGLLNAILDLDIQDLNYVNPLNLQEYLGDKQSEMDIEVVTSSGERLNIEIQLRAIGGFKNRIVYYGAKLLTESLDEGETYNKMNRCKVISILDFNLFPDTPEIMSCLTLQERHRHEEYSDILELVFLEMPKLKEKSVDEMGGMEKWLYFLRYVQGNSRREKIEEITKESEGFQMAYEMLYEVSADERLRSQLRSQEKYYRDRLSEIADALETGEKRGIEKGRMESARGMIKLGLDDEMIMEITSLSPKVVQALREEV